MYQGIFEPHLVVVCELSCEANTQDCLLSLVLSGPIYYKTLGLHHGGRICFDGYKSNLGDGISAPY